MMAKERDPAQAEFEEWREYYVALLSRGLEVPEAARLAHDAIRIAAANREAILKAHKKEPE